MFSKIGTGELVVILLVALIIFGPSKLPALGKMAGKAIGTLRGYVEGNNWEELLEDEEEDKVSVKKNAAQTSEEKTAQKQESKAAAEPTMEGEPTEKSAS